MTIQLKANGVSVVLVDIEGTTTPISFVFDTLFPYARRHLRGYIHAHAADADVRKAVGMLAGEREREPIHTDAPDWDHRSRDSGIDSAADFAEWLMTRDSKSPGLKTLQGLVWKVGYESGAIHGDVYDDVPTALREWQARGIRIAIYSSGSVLAQKLIFGTTKYGDLTPMLDAYFDTAVGPKREPSSYTAIARAMGVVSRAILFLSDVAAELQAARRAGLQVALVVRPGNATQSEGAAFETIRSLAEIQT